MMYLYIVFLFISFHLQATEFEKLQQKFNGLEKFSVTFTQYIEGKKGLSGTFYYMKGNKLRLELKNVVLVSDGKSVWSYNKSLKKITITNLEGSPLESLNLSQFVNVYPKDADIKDIVVDGKSGFRLTSKKSNAEFNEATIFLNSEGLMAEISLVNKNSSVTRITFSSYKLESNIPDKLFEMEQPEGVKIVDLR